MKTTIDIADGLLAEARKAAARDKTTMREIMEQGLRLALRQRKKKKPRYRWEPVTFTGQGLNPELGEWNWEKIRDLIYEGRGA